MSNELCDECEELKEELELLTIDYDELEGILNNIKDLIRYM